MGRNGRLPAGNATIRAIFVGNRSRVRLRRAEGNQSVHELIEHAVELDVSGFFLITLPVQGGRARVMRLAMPRSRPH